jgi:small subunit ribosomal protein S1
VLKFDRAKERVSLGIKQLEPDPWEAVLERYPVNSRVIGRVVNVTDYGAFVELEAGVEGLIHISEMTWSRRMKHPSKVVKPGDQVEAVVLEVHSKDRRISLGLKQLEPNPWTTIDTPLQRGLGGGGPGAQHDRFRRLHRNRGRHRRPGARLRSVLDQARQAPLRGPEEGQIVQAVILNIDSSSHRLSLGIKQLQPDAWESYFQNHQVGDTVHGRVCRLASFGAFRRIGRRRGRLVPFLRSAGLYGPARAEESPLAVGQEFDFKIIKMSEAEKKIGLSLRAVTDDEEKNRLEDYQRQAAAATTTIEEVMSLKDRNLE